MSTETTGSLIDPSGSSPRVQDTVVWSKHTEGAPCQLLVFNGVQLNNKLAGSDQRSLKVIGAIRSSVLIRGKCCCTCLNYASA
jgi:hypothetical protein